MSCAYWAPKSTTRTGFCIGKSYRPQLNGTPWARLKGRVHVSGSPSAYGPCGLSTTHTCIINGIAVFTAKGGQLPYASTTVNPGANRVTQTLCECQWVSGPPGSGAERPA